MDDLETLHKLVSYEERLARLDDKQQAIVMKRQEESAARSIVIAKLFDADPEVHEHAFNTLRDMTPDMCEHDRSIWSPCMACAEIDHLMYPEVFNEFGEKIEEVGYEDEEINEDQEEADR
jgi:hypothetical protein